MLHHAILTEEGGSRFNHLSSGWTAPHNPVSTELTHLSLYDPRSEKDACGVGFIATTTGNRKPVLGMALDSLCRLAHRGAVGFDKGTGDGAGVLTQIPRSLMADEAARLTGASVNPERIAVGVFFLPQESSAQRGCMSLIEEAFKESGVPFHAWREVPINSSVIGDWAKRTRPHIVHALVSRPQNDDEERFERRLFTCRKRIERQAAQVYHDALYVASLSARTIIYKGLLMADQLAEFYLDLRDTQFETALAIYHQRYSTNTTPTWRRAQPFRMLAHNGEINTLQGNVNWMRAREGLLSSPHFDTQEILPVIDEDNSDSGMLDNALELLYMGGRDSLHAVRMLIPEAWEGIQEMEPQLKGFYQYHASLVEPWDGPAALAFSDGRIVGASLDRNGLRPLRYTVTKDGMVIAGSEVGTTPIAPEEVELHGKLGPGQMIAVDVIQGTIHGNRRIKEEIAGRRAYGTWVAEQSRSIDELVSNVSVDTAPDPDVAAHLESDADGLVRQQAAFGYTSEELTVVLRPMVENAKEPNGSMGDDTPHAVLSKQNRPLFHYFKERFAEVTNPPIDHLRERLVFSLRTLLGPRQNLLAQTPEHARLIVSESPILLDHEMAALEAFGAREAHFRSARVSALFPVAQGEAALEAAVLRLTREAEAAVDKGASLLIISDRGVDEAHAPIPSLMAVGAVHHHLMRVGKRMRVSLVAQTGEPREVHHFAALIGYGASCVHPYLALTTIRQQVEEGRIRIDDVTVAEAQERYKEAVEEGLLKVMSKMGISTLDSYTGAQIFESVGLNPNVIDTCFVGTSSSVSGSDFADIGRTSLTWHREAFAADFNKLGMYGFYKPRKSGEFHDYTPETARQLQKAVKLAIGDDDDAFEQGYEEYKRFVAAIRSHPGQLRDLLAFNSDRKPIPLSQVEPEEAIFKRFSTAQMSLGSLSPEAHETLSIAMNRLGGRSGSGEGGEDPSRFGTERNSAVKQVASGRFGVTAGYLASAKEIQIKMAQGSKPGEGGQIPGHKVTDLIARLRNTVPGVALISPPPHHDIYSIEDLAQLIYDLKQSNPEAEVSVKLVSQTGVGIIAAGVAKGYADIILISGNAGGTGSSPLNSIKNAGLPWEIGLAETQQALLANGLRERVSVRADGGMKHGRDVVIAAILGADEYSFGTAAMIAEGCIMARVCHTNNCPVGVATQKPELRAKFPGRAEMVMAYFAFLAREVRELLAQLGYSRLEEIIGRTELLTQSPDVHEASPKLDLRPLLAVPEGAAERVRHRTWHRNPLPGEIRLDPMLIERTRKAIEEKQPVVIETEIENRHRTVGAGLAYAVAKRHGDSGLPRETIRVRFTGTAGQSFGAFLVGGVHFHLFGQANDYVGKCMAGGEIVVRPDRGATFAPHENVIVGNTVLYGASGGELYASGQAGERFAVRNSGATAVVEGVGDHGCEYMTGGTVVVLGPTGYNFGAGMTGGEAFILDEEGRFSARLNDQMVTAHPLETGDFRRLRKLLLNHYEKTSSPKAAELLRNWERNRSRFLRVSPRAEVGALSQGDEGAIAQ